MSHIQPGLEWQVRLLADAARHENEQAKNSLDVAKPTGYVDPSIRAEAYAAGVEDVLRFICGDAEPTEELRPIYEQYLRIVDEAIDGPPTTEASNK